MVDAPRGAERAITRAVNDLAMNPAVDGIEPNNRLEVAEALKDKLAPVLISATNNEPWYQSRVTLGAILAVISGILGGFGYALPDEVRGQIVDLIIVAGPIIGGLVTLYGRWKARKPIGA